MKKTRLSLVLVLLAVLPSAYAQPSLALGWQIIIGWLQNIHVQMGVMLSLLALFLYSAISSSITHIPLFKGSPEQEKLGKIAAVCLTGIVVIGAFFYRTNAYDTFTRFASVLPWFFAVLFSLVLALGLRQLLKSQEIKAKPFGQNIENIAAYIAFWAMLYLLANAQSDSTLTAIAAIGATIGTLLFLSGSDWYSHQPGAIAKRSSSNIAEDTRRASEDAHQASARAGEAASAASGATSHVQAAQQELQQAGNVAVAAPETALEHVAKSVEEAKAAEKEEIKVLIKVENAVSLLRRMHKELVERTSLLTNVLRSIEPEKRKPEWNKFVSNAIDVEHDAEEMIPKFEQQKDELKTGLQSNLNELKKEGKIISRRQELLKDKKLPEKERTRIQKSIDKHEGIRAGLLRQNQSVITKLTVFAENIKTYSEKIGQILSTGIPDVSEMTLEYAQETQAASEAKSLFDIAIKANGAESGSALTKLAELDRQGVFEAKINYFFEAADRLRDANVKYYEGGNEKFGKIAPVGKLPPTRSPLVRGRLLIERPDGRYSLNLQGIHRLEFTKP
jgi:hypothetical protein